jgi:hypothetical protein
MHPGRVPAVSVLGLWMERAMTDRPAKTWADVTRDSEAMDEVRAIIEQYLPPNSPLSEMETLARIIAAIEHRTGRKIVQYVMMRLP